MTEPFFSGPIFAWIFVLSLVALLIWAAVCDVRALIIPKIVTLPTLVLGFLFNLIRGGLLGAHGMKTWLFEPDGLWLGMADGFLFALLGMLFGFGLFFVMWILGLAGGGDVKMFTALGAWVGNSLILLVLAACVIVVTLFVLAVFAYNLVTVGILAAMSKPKPQELAVVGDKGKSKGRGSAEKPNERPARRKPRKRNGLGLPLAIAATAVLLVAFRYDLKLEVRPTPPPPGSQQHAP